MNYWWVNHRQTFKQEVLPLIFHLRRVQGNGYIRAILLFMNYPPTLVMGVNLSKIGERGSKMADKWWTIKNSKSNYFCKPFIYNCMPMVGPVGFEPTTKGL